MSAFPLLILVISLFRRVVLISVATVSSLVGLGLIVVYGFLEGTVDGEWIDQSLSHASYNLIFSVCVLLTGIVSCLQVHRLNKHARTR